jgi:hypothetical protein
MSLLHVLPSRTETLIILSPSSTPTSRRLFRICADSKTSFDTLTGKVTKPYDGQSK